MPNSRDERPTVLVVDDDPANLRTFQRVFRRKLRVLAASSGAEALQLAATTPVDLAFIDYTMPRMTGGQLLVILRERHPEIVRFLLTGSADLAAITEMAGNGLAFGILPKPWNTAMVEAAVRAAMGKPLVFPG